MKTVIEKFFTEDFVEIHNVDGHKIILKTSFIAYIVYNNSPPPTCEEI